jgi:Bacterial PH domain
MKAVSHRHSAGHEHEFEPVPGLPEALPAGERILWQGAPDARALALRAFHLRKLAIYFALLLLWRGAIALGDGASAWQALRSVAVLTPLALLALGLVGLLAWLSARTTCYTLTNHRVVMRIGIVLTVAFNLPLKRLAAADLREAPLGCGDIALALSGRDRIAWLHLWPHARPWHLRQPQPMLRCVPEGARVARLIAQAWSAETGHEPTPVAAAPIATPQPTNGSLGGAPLGAH